MARPSNLSSMSVEALLKLRDDIGATLSRKADELKGQLSRLTGRGDVGGGRKKGRATKGRKVAAKYQDSEGNTWAGRGAQPRWLTAAIKSGKKREDFLIDKSAASRKAAKPTRGRRKK
jgi:DNA-binding protein H-NS